MESFVDLPLDLQTNILDYSRYGKRINKLSSEHNEKLFYDKYCQLPISKHELLNYIEQYQPPYFVIFVINGFNFFTYIFSLDEESGYTIKKLVYKSYPGILKYYNYETEETIDEIYDMDTYKTMIEIDLNLTENIIAQRQCKNINPTYIDDYIYNKFEMVANHNFNRAT